MRSQTLAICFGQFGPYHHARVAALQDAAHEQGARVVPVQISSDTATYEWKENNESQVKGKKCEGLQTLCNGVEEEASPLDVFLKARKLFRDEKVDVAFLPSYSPARYFALFAAAKSLGIRTVMMNESHAGTEQATGWKRWIKRQIVKQFDAAFVGGEPHKRHFASLDIPADKIFTGYDAVDGDFFASRADEIRAEAKKSFQFSVFSVQSEKDESSKDQETKRQTEAEHLSTLNSQPSTKQSVRSAYGLPERYFLSLGRMVEKKNLSTLVEAYARFARASVEKHGAGSGEHGEKKHGAGSGEHGEKKHGAGSMEPRVNLTENCKLNTEHCAPALVFVGSGELEGALRAQARGLGLRVIDRSGWKAGESSHSRVFETAEGKLTRISTDGSERLPADRTKGNAASSVARAGCEGPQSETDDCELTPDDSAAQRGAVYFYGFRQIEENPVFYALAEAFVLPSLKEEWGLVVNEAMAAGLPVIVSRTAGCAEDLLPGSESWQCSVGSVQSGKEKKADDCKLMTDDSLEQRSNGFVFDPKSSDALSEALKRVADYGTTGLQDNGTNMLAQMSQQSREIVAKFSCENFARQALRAAEAASA